jgi:hypothetical protein
LGGARGHGTLGHHDVHRELDQRGDRGEALLLALGIAELDHQVLALDVAQIAKHCRKPASMEDSGVGEPS